MRLFLCCNSCEIRFDSELELSYSEFENRKLLNNIHGCPEGHFHAYDKNDYRVELSAEEIVELTKKLRDCKIQYENMKSAYEILEKRVNKVPEEGVTIFPLEEDMFECFVGLKCEGYQFIAHAGRRFAQFLPPNMKIPITVTTQIKQLKDIATYENDWLSNPIEFRKPAIHGHANDYPS